MKFSKTGLAMVGIVFSAVLQAHPLDLGLLKVSREAHRITAELQIHPDVATTLLRLEASPPSMLTLESRAQDLLKATLSSGKWQIGEEICVWENPRSAFQEKSVVLNAESHCASASEAWAWEFPFLSRSDLPPRYQLMVRGLGQGSEQLSILDSQHSVLAWNWNRGSGWVPYFFMGMAHIGAVPSEWWSDGRFHLPEGIDHILFVLALALGGGSLLSLIGTATGFTVGHCITLALGSFGLVHLPSQWVESAIALSIVYMAIESLWRKNNPGRWKVAVFFGLVHGLGFATALTELGLKGPALVRALIGFNLGVEVAQALILMISAPLIAWLLKLPYGRRVAIPACSIALSIVAGVWFVQRSFSL